MILAIDAAQTLGFCSGKESGTHQIKIGRKEPIGVKIPRFKEWLNNYLDKNKDINFIVYELPTGRWYNSLKSGCWLESIIILTCFERGMGYLGVSATEIKKFACNNGRASKEDMVNSAKKEWDFEIIDNNHADSLWLYKLAIEQKLKIK